MEALKHLARNVTKKPIPAVSPEIKTVTSVESVNLLDLVNNKSIEEQEKQSQLRKSAELQTKSHAIIPPMPPASMLLGAGVSGGSSPSREVQEILSLKDSDCMNDFFHDSEDNQDETDGSGDNADVPDAMDNDENEDIDDNEEDMDENGEEIEDDEENENENDDEENEKISSEEGTDDIEDAKEGDAYKVNAVNGKRNRFSPAAVQDTHLTYIFTSAIAKDLYGGQSKELQNNGLSKTEWPTAPNVSHSSNKHLYKQSASPLNDISYKLDQLLGNYYTKSQTPIQPFL